MPDHLHYEDDELFNRTTHHEESDVNVRALLWFAVVFVIFAIVSHFALWFLYKGFVRSERNNNTAPMTGLERPAELDVPQEQPLLQPFPRQDAKGEVIAPNANTPVTDLDDMRKAEEKVLRNYGWVDRQKGIVHVPIDVAKQMVVDRGVLQQAAAVAPPATATTPATTAPATTATTTTGGHP